MYNYLEVWYVVSPSNYLYLLLLIRILKTRLRIDDFVVQEGKVLPT